MRLSQFVKFSLVGAAGFLVDVTSFYLCAPTLPNPFPRIVSFTSAVIFTYALNRSITFRFRQRKFWKQFPAYLLSMMGGGSINLLVFFLLQNYSLFFFDRPYISIALGSVAGLIFNFILSLKIFKS